MTQGRASPSGCLFQPQGAPLHVAYREGPGPDLRCRSRHGGHRLSIAAADSDAHGAAAHSPGVLSGNVVQVPVHIPVNVCGNTVNVIGLLNPAFGNTCVNG